MGGIVKAVKKVVKGVTKAVKKVVKGIGKVVSKVTEKLGPIGTIAVSMIAPYAIGAMAGAGGWVGALGKGLQAIGSAISAPFKALSAVGKNLLGSAFQGASELAGAAFGQGNSISSALTSAADYFGVNASNAWSPIQAGKDAFGSAWDAASKSFGEAVDGVKSAMGMGQDAVASQINGSSYTDMLMEQTADFGYEGMKATAESYGIDMSANGQMGMLQEQMAGFGPEEWLDTANSLATDSASGLAAPTFDPQAYLDNPDKWLKETPWDLQEQVAGQVGATPGSDQFNLLVEQQADFGTEGWESTFGGTGSYADTQAGLLAQQNAGMAQSVSEANQIASATYDSSNYWNQESTGGENLWDKAAKALNPGLADFGALAQQAGSGIDEGGYTQESAEGQKAGGEYGLAEDFYVLSNGNITSASGHTGLQQGSGLASLLQSKLGTMMTGTARAYS